MVSCSATTSTCETSTAATLPLRVISTCSLVVATTATSSGSRFVASATVTVSDMARMLGRSNVMPAWTRHLGSLAPAPPPPAQGRGAPAQRVRDHEGDGDVAERAGITGWLGVNGAVLAIEFTTPLRIGRSRALLVGRSRPSRACSLSAVRRAQAPLRWSPRHLVRSPRWSR